MKETSFSVANSCVKPVFVNDGTRLLRLDVEDVFYVGAEDHYCHVYKAGGKRVCTLFTSLRAVLDALNNGSFAQISRYEFVNIWHIREIIGNILILEDGKRLTISRSFRGQIEDFLCVLNHVEEEDNIGEQNIHYGGMMPDILLTDTAKAELQKYVDAGLLTDGYQPAESLSRTQKAVLAHDIAERLEISTVWKTFEPFWNMKAMKPAYNAGMKQKSMVDFQKALNSL